MELTPSLKSVTRSWIPTSRTFSLLFSHFVKVFCWTVIHCVSSMTIAAAVSMAAACKD
jgi:hypothetical protein